MKKTVRTAEHPAAHPHRVHGLRAHQRALPGLERDAGEAAAAPAAQAFDVPGQLGRGGDRQRRREGFSCGAPAAPLAEAADHRRRAEPEAEEQPEKKEAQVAQPRVGPDGGRGRLRPARGQPDADVRRVHQLVERARVLLHLAGLDAARGGRELGADVDHRPFLLVRHRSCTGRPAGRGRPRGASPAAPAARCPAAARCDLLHHVQRVRQLQRAIFRSATLRSGLSCRISSRKRSWKPSFSRPECRSSRSPPAGPSAARRAGPAIARCSMSGSYAR